jgi:hypothetical protein
MGVARARRESGTGRNISERTERSDAMNPKRNTTTASGPWGVSITSQSGIAGRTLSLYRRVAPGKFAFAEGNDKKFENDAQADAYALEKGYTSYYGRNVVEFVSSRAFRKHTGLLTNPNNKTYGPIMYENRRKRGKRAA